MLRTPRRTLTRIKDATLRLYRCEKGAEGIEKLLIIGAVVIPLLALLIIFRDKITEWTQDMWSDVQDDSESYDPDF
tara:strand:- start:523 stop:750 length:228 start_codon:yes stop_codon:yes gene_type:complete